MTEFGVNAIVLPAGIDTGPHMHERQQELYFVHAGEIEIEFGDGSTHRLGPGGLARVDAADRAHDPQPRPRRRRLRRRRRRGRLRRPRRAAARGRRRQPAADLRLATVLTAHTAYLTFETAERREFVRITDEVQAAVDESGIREGMVLVSAMHITAGGLDQRRRARDPGRRARVARQARPALVERSRRTTSPASSHPTPATTATTAAARTTATPT